MTRMREGSPKGNTVSLVIPGIPTDVTEEQFLHELHANNDGRFSDFQGQAFRDSIHSVSCLSRHVTSESGKGSWVPSRSMRLVMAKNVGAAILARGTLVLRFRSIPVREYNPPTRTCFRSGREGHEARFCRSAAKCRVCEGGHPVWECPRNRTMGGEGTSLGGGVAGEGRPVPETSSGRTDLPPTSW